ncbi:MAG: class I SAM-dependent methyltransferase [Candidatus Binataceae bacterium]
MDEISAHLSIARQQFQRRPHVYANMQTPADQKFLAFMVSTSGAGKSDCVLDVACGPGAATLAFAERCKRAVGLDLSPELLTRARAEAAARAVENAAFMLSELERMAFADGAFTGAVCRFSFHHFVNPERVFAEMARVVAPGGWMMIADTAASEDADKAALHNELERLCDPTHSRALAPSEFERMFDAHGFSVTMKIARDARMTVDDWIRFGNPPAENVEKLRELAQASVEEDRTGLKFLRDRDTIRMVHTTINFVIEKSA